MSDQKRGMEIKMNQQLFKVLNKNKCVPVNIKEKEEILNKWIKRIRKQLLIDIIFFSIHFGFMYVALLEKREVIVEEIMRYFLIIVVLYPIVCGVKYIIYEIVGYKKSQKAIWTKTLIYIIRINKNKLEICYVQEEKLCRKEINPRYKEIRGKENTFFTLVHFKGMNQDMLLEDYSWVENDLGEVGMDKLL